MHHVVNDDSDRLIIGNKKVPTFLAGSHFGYLSAQKHFLASVEKNKFVHSRNSFAKFGLKIVAAHGLNCMV